MEKIRIQKASSPQEVRQLWMSWKQEFDIVKVRNGQLIGIDIAKDLVDCTGWIIIGIKKAGKDDELAKPTDK